MSRPLRIQYPGALYHVISRGNGRQTIFLDEGDYRRFLKLLEDQSKRLELIVYAYCLMPNHFHLFMETQQANLATAMRQLKGAYSVYFNWRHQRVGHLFQGRYQAILVEKESYLLELTRYIHLNPVRAGLAQGVSDYPWSSAQAYVGRVHPPPFLRCTYVLNQFATSLEEGHKRYTEFLADGLQTHKLRHQKIQAGVLLGSPTFIEQVKARYVAGRTHNPEVPAIGQLQKRPSLEDLSLSITKDFLSDGSRRPLSRRNLLIYLGWQLSGFSQRQLAQEVGLSYFRVSHLIAEVQRAVSTDMQLAQQVNGVISRFGDRGGGQTPKNSGSDPNDKAPTT